MDQQNRRPERRTEGWRRTGWMVLLGSLALGVIGIMPTSYNPLVGVFGGPESADDLPLVMIVTSIPVHAADLPAKRPSLGVARAVDQVEAALVVEAASARTTGTHEREDLSPAEVAAAGVAAPMSPSAMAASLPLVKAPSPPAQTKTAPMRKPPGSTGPGEDFDMQKRRAFNAER